MAWYDWVTLFHKLRTLQSSVDVIDDKLNQALLLLAGARPARHLRIDYARTQLLNKKGDLLMSGTANVTTDHDLRVPLVWKDDVGVVSAPTSGTTATSDNPAVATVEVAADDLSIVIRSLTVGSCNVAVANDKMTDSISVNVTEPSASALNVDAADATLVAKGTPA